MSKYTDNLLTFNIHFYIFRKQSFAVVSKKSKSSVKVLGSLQLNSHLLKYL